MRSQLQEVYYRRDNTNCCYNWKDGRIEDKSCRNTLSTTGKYNYDGLYTRIETK